MEHLVQYGLEVKCSVSVQVWMFHHEMYYRALVNLCCFEMLVVFRLEIPFLEFQLVCCGKMVVVCCHVVCAAEAKVAVSLTHLI